MRWKHRGRVQGSGIRGQGAEVGSRKSEVRNQKSEVRGRKSKVESRKSGRGFRPSTSGLWPLTAVFCFLLFGDASAVGAFEQVGADTTTHADSVTVKSPMGALVRSMVVPGWGQWYNERPIKGAVIFSTGLFLGGAMMYEQQRTLDHRQRNTYFLWFLGVFLYNIADAYVDAHLYGFEEDAETAARQPRNQNPKNNGTRIARIYTDQRQKPCQKNKISQVCCIGLVYGNSDDRMPMVFMRIRF
ncbi:MAG: hypothetical protein J7M27_10800 [Candidatus Latescibacteria bacterium]|nr:hypothetical protein [Candidatus Latescibacterota bacterium]